MTDDSTRSDPRRRPGATGRALVTGASSGIGRELARLLAADGYDVLLVARTEPALKELAGELSDRYGVQADPIVADLSHPGAPAEVMRQAGVGDVPLDVLVNNAGVGTSGAFAQTPVEDTLRLLQLNVSSLTALTGLALPGMVGRGSGRILNVSSTAAFQPGPLMAAYYASKAYVQWFSEALAEEVRGTGVTVTALCPGVTPSGFQAKAGVERSRLVKRFPRMQPAKVARIGYRAMQAGKPMVVTGLFNKVQVQSLRFAPRRVTTVLARRLNEPV